MKLSQQQSIEALLFFILGNQNTGWVATGMYVIGCLSMTFSIINGSKNR